MAATTMTTVKTGTVETKPSGRTLRQTVAVGQAATVTIVHNLGSGPAGTGTIDGSIHGEDEIDVKVNPMNAFGIGVYISAKDANSISLTEINAGAASVEVTAHLLHSVDL